MLLTEGMIIPIRARAAWWGLSMCPLSIIVVASMVVISELESDKVSGDQNN